MNNLPLPIFTHPFRDLGASFFADVTPEAVTHPHWIHFNAPLAAQMGLPTTSFDVDLFSGNQLFEGQNPLAMLYAGHQFGHYTPQLGDGRAMQLGSTQHNGERMEWQLKGAGRTPFSRGSDGRAVLRSSIREYLCSAAMVGLGIPTTQALSLVGSTTPVYREQRETAALVMRIAPSFVRFGSFEVFFYRGQILELKALADFVMTEHYPQCAAAEQPYVALLNAVIERTAVLVAHWQAVGFCHGVLNSDNMSILGLTLDYGPFGFLDTYNPAHICNHSDHEGRYSFENQPFIGSWNLHCLAQALLPLIDDIPTVKTALAAYWPQFTTHLHGLMCEKLGLFEPQHNDADLIQETLAMLAHNHLDYTRFFRRLADFEIDHGAAIRSDCLDLPAFDAWASTYAARLMSEPNSARMTRMNAVNPKYILRNHLAQEAIERAERGDFSEVSVLFECLQHPFEEQTQYERLNSEPEEGMAVEVSCSS